MSGDSETTGRPAGFRDEHGNQWGELLGGVAGAGAAVLAAVVFGRGNTLHTAVMMLLVFPFALLGRDLTADWFEGNREDQGAEVPDGAVRPQERPRPSVEEGPER